MFSGTILETAKVKQHPAFVTQTSDVVCALTHTPIESPPAIKRMSAKGKTRGRIPAYDKAC
jgi:hypothetical protein